MFKSQCPWCCLYCYSQTNACVLLVKYMWFFLFFFPKRKNLHILLHMSDFLDTAYCLLPFVAVVVCYFSLYKAVSCICSLFFIMENCKHIQKQSAYDNEPPFIRHPASIIIKSQLVFFYVLFLLPSHPIHNYFIIIPAILSLHF